MERDDVLALASNMSLEQLQTIFQQFCDSVQRQMEAPEELKSETKEESAAIADQLLMEGSREELIVRRDQIAEMLSALEERAKRIRKTVQNAEKLARHYESFGRSIESSILTFMLDANLREVEGFLHRFKVYNSPAQLIITDEKAIPDKYFTKVISTELNKEMLKGDLAAGHEVPGAFLDTERKRLDVK